MRLMRSTRRPVRAGEIQARNLGMDVDVFDEEGKPVAAGAGEGDLVCKVRALPVFPYAQPLTFPADAVPGAAARLLGSAGEPAFRDVSSTCASVCATC